MKKLRLLVMPLMAIPFLVSCANAGGGDDPGPTVKHKLHFSGTDCILLDENKQQVTEDKEFESGQNIYYYIAGKDGQHAVPKQDAVKVTLTSSGEEFTDTWEYDESTGSITIKMTADVTISATSGLMWYLDASYINSLIPSDVTKENPDGSIGVVQTLKVNGLNHKVRLIGVNEDVDSEDNTIHTTWEFANLISDENGFSLATYWNDTATTLGSNYNYKTSTIRKALIGDTNDINWFRYYGEEEDAVGTGKNRHFAAENNYKISVLDMINNENEGLVNVLKTPSKYIDIYNSELATPAWEEKTVEDKLFLLSPVEMGRESHEHEETNTTTYSYYAGTSQQVGGEPKRIKHQIKWREGEGARTYALSGDDFDGTYTGTKYTFAGHNDPTSEDYGSISWSRSPSIDGGNAAWVIGAEGDFYHESDNICVNSFALCVAPAFCI